MTDLPGTTTDGTKDGVTLMAGLAPEHVEKIAAELSRMGVQVRTKHGMPNCYVVVPNRRNAKPITFGPSDNYKEAEQLLVRLRRAGLDRAMRNALGMPAKKPKGKVDASLIDALEQADVNADKWLDTKPLPDDITDRARDLSARFTFTDYALARLEARGISLFEAYAAILHPDYSQTSKHYEQRRLHHRGDVVVCVQNGEKVITVYDANSLLRVLEDRGPRRPLIPGEPVKPVSPAPPPAVFSAADTPQPARAEPTSAPLAPQPAPRRAGRTGNLAPIDATLTLQRALCLVLEVEYEVGATGITHGELIDRLRPVFGPQLVNIHAQLSMAINKYRLIERTGPGQFTRTDPQQSTLAREATTMQPTSTGNRAIINGSMTYIGALREILDTEYADGDEVTRAALIARLADTHPTIAGIDNALHGLKHREHRLDPKGDDEPGVYIVRRKAAPPEPKTPAPANGRPVAKLTKNMSTSDAVSEVLRVEYAPGDEVRPILVINRICKALPHLDESAVRAAFQRHYATAEGLMTKTGHGVYRLNFRPGDEPGTGPQPEPDEQPVPQPEPEQPAVGIVLLDDDDLPTAPTRPAVPAQRRSSGPTKPEFVFELLDDDTRPSLEEYLEQFMPLAVKLRDHHPGRWATLMRIPGSQLPGDLESPDGRPMALHLTFLPVGNALEVRAKWEPQQ